MSTGPIPMPTPEPTPGPSLSDPCIVPFTTATIGGTWTDDCESLERDDSYARFYTFVLVDASDVTITLTTPTSEVDTFLYVREGVSKGGEALHEKR